MIDANANASLERARMHLPRVSVVQDLAFAFSREVDGSIGWILYRGETLIKKGQATNEQEAVLFVNCALQHFVNNFTFEIRQW